MPLRIVRLGSNSLADEGVRIGTVRRLLRGVRKKDFSRLNWYDVWLPALSPGPEVVRLALDATTEREWNTFVRKYRSEMSAADNPRTVNLLGTTKEQTTFS